MSNNWTKQYKDSESLFEADLDALASALKPEIANLDLATTGSSADYILTSNGSAIAPSFKTPNTVAATISAAGANSIIGAVSSITASVANAIVTASVLGDTQINSTSSAVSLLSTSNSIIATISSVTTTGTYVIQGNFTCNFYNTAGASVSLFAGGTGTLKINSATVQTRSGAISETVTSSSSILTTLSYATDFSFFTISSLTALDQVRVDGILTTSGSITTTTGDMLGDIRIIRLY